MKEPHTIDRAWREEFVIALRMRDVEGAVIADQLKLVELHCAESGETVQEAFGDARAYAAEVSGRTDDAGVLDLLPTAAVAFVGGSLLVRGGFAVLEGESVAVTVGNLVAAVLLVGASLALVRIVTAMRRPMVPALAVAAVATTLAVLADVADTPQVTSVPAAVALAAGVLVLAIVAVASARSARRHRIIDPVTGRPMA